MSSKSTLAALALVTILSLGCADPSVNSNSATPGSSSVASNSKEKKVALISITSDPSKDLQEVNMGLTFAGFCVDEGFDVNIFLNVKGVHLATNSFSAETKFMEHSPLKEQLIALTKRGAQVHVCPVCMKDFSIDAGEIIPEAFVTSKPKLFGKIGSDTVVFTY